MRREDDQPDDSGRMPLEVRAFAKSLDFKIPLWGVLGLLGALAYWLITMNIQQQQILQAMAELKVSVTAGNNQLAANAGEIAIMKFRMEKVESDHAKLLERAGEPLGLHQHAKP